ncbi:hypothetical protein [Nocardia sp. NPDC020380]|uniref:hypothetical protein n=1 Tax=Nocardia sp. NPDC020380 TaxID=3364309 RepID=UPI0037933974
MDPTTAPAATVATPSADPIADPAPAAGFGAPMWASLLATSAPWFKDLTTLSRHQAAAPVLGLSPIQFLNRRARTTDQSLTVNIATRPTRTPATTGENARVLGYGGALLR